MSEKGQLQTQGLHHITAIASDAKQTDNFYTKILKMRRVKKTVNFDDPTVYHTYYADEIGTPGTLLTFFPYKGAKSARHGNNEVTQIRLCTKDLKEWEDQLIKEKVAYGKFEVKGKSAIKFEDPDGMLLAIIESEKEYPTFHSVKINVPRPEPTKEVLQILGYEESHGEDNVITMQQGTHAVEIVANERMLPFQPGAGSVHHIAFAVENQEEQEQYRKYLIEQGLRPTTIIDRDYFTSIYFRDANGILFEIATKGPGMLIDEEKEHLGEGLRLPKQHEHLREHLEQVLPPI